MTSTKKIQFDEKIAMEGDTIAYYYYGVPARGTVRKILTNSVIVSVEGLNKNKIKAKIQSETVIGHKHYAVTKSKSKTKHVSIVS